jgi:hypothetical protein
MKFLQHAVELQLLSRKRDDPGQIAMAFRLADSRPEPTLLALEVLLPQGR